MNYKNNNKKASKQKDQQQSPDWMDGEWRYEDGLCMNRNNCLTIDR